MDSTAAVRKTLSRWQASGLHLAISAFIAATVLAVMLGAWYPRPLFEIEGGMGLVYILVGVDVVIGPLITLVVFKSGKPGMKFDLWVIGILQAAALAYGCHIVAAVRPAFIAFVKDQFETVSAGDLAPADLAAARPEFRSLPLTGPMLVAVNPPSDPKERSDVLFSALAGGKDLRHFPKYYVPYAGYAEEVIAKGHTVAALQKRDPVKAKAIESWLAGTGIRADDVKYLPLRGGRGWGMVLVDARSAAVLKMLPEPAEAP